MTEMPDHDGTGSTPLTASTHVGALARARVSDVLPMTSPDPRVAEWEGVHWLWLLAQQEAAAIAGQSSGGADDPPGAVYQAVMCALHHSGRPHHEVLMMMNTLHEEGHVATAYEYSLVMASCIRGSQPELTLNVLALMTEHGCDADHATYTVLMRALAKLGDDASAKDVLDAMRVARYSPNIGIYNDALRACAKARSINSALHIIDDMGRWGVTPDRLTFNIAMDVFAKAAAANTNNKKNKSDMGTAQARRRMVELFETIGTPGLMATLDAGRENTTPLKGYETELTSLAKTGDWTKALSIITAMRRSDDSHIRRSMTSVHWTNAISACARARPPQWREALSLLDTMRNDGLKPDTMAYNAVMSALARARRWQVSE